MLILLLPTSMARTLPQHKTNYAGFVDPHYLLTPVDPKAWRQKFQAFSDSCFDEIPDEGQPADAYMYNTHMGAFVRALDEAKDHFVKGFMAFCAKRGSASITEDKT